MEDLHRDPRCTAHLHDLIDLVEIHMLVFPDALRSIKEARGESIISKDIEGRISSEDLVLQLEAMLAKSTNEYLTSPAQWDRQEVIRTYARAVEDPKPRRTLEELRMQLGNRTTLAEAFNISSIRLSLRGRDKPHSSIAAEAPQLIVGAPELHRMAEKVPPLTNVIDSGHSAKPSKRRPEDLLLSTLEHDLAPREVEFILHWELRQCIRDNLSGGPLGPVLTISGDEIHSWAVSCDEYARSMWGETGQDLLNGLSLALGDGSSVFQYDSRIGSIEYTLAAADNESSAISLVTVTATPKNLAMVAEFLVWIAKTFRRPSKTSECVASDASFTALSMSSFVVELENLRPLDPRQPGTCWRVLFPNTVIAYGCSVPTMSALLGLRISLGAMIDLAGIVQDVTLEDDDGCDKGTYLDGMTYLIYPTNHDQAANEVQWHLVKKTPENMTGFTLRPDLDEGLSWLTDVSPDTLGSATAILGYCGEVRVTLGTKSRMQQYKQYMSSGTGVESPPAEAVLTNITAGFTSGINPIRGNAAMTANIQYPRGLMEGLQEREETSFIDMLDHAAEQPVILFETEPGEERAWMVPKLAVILDLFNFWAVRQGGSVEKSVRFVEEGFDAGHNAKKVLEDKRYVNKVVQKKLHNDDKDTTVGDIIKKIFRALCKLERKDAEANDSSRKIKLRLGRQPITGWDPLELIDGEIVLYRRDIRSNTGLSRRASEKPAWLPLMDSAPLLVMQGLGQVIVPAHQGQLCRNWDPVPGGYENNYLVAMVRCLEFLAGRNMAPGQSSGTRNTWVLKGHGKQQTSWQVHGESLFQDCDDSCKRNPQHCWKDIQRLSKGKAAKLMEAKKTSWLKRALPRKTQMARGPMRIPRSGAVVFAKDRKELNPIALVTSVVTANDSRSPPEKSLLSLTLVSIPQIVGALIVFTAAAFLGKIFL